MQNNDLATLLRKDRVALLYFFFAKMYLLTYLQTTYHLSRRTIVDFIKQGKILVNQHPIQSFKHIVSP
ncbi:MAG: hypothetical protein LBG59_01920 [Candidatus Peribacteria bacterium]|nr:hypothetical protein [Candidatus Peribacteria bacterium]